MKRSPAEDVVAFLSFSPDTPPNAQRLRKLSRSQWERLLQWLHDAGLAFYFLQKFKSTNGSEAVPAWVISQLECHLAANRQRVAAMSRRFGLINQMFNAAGVRYAVLKGQSLVPQFCPDAVLRYQGDFDYLVDEESLPKAQRILGEAGYRPKPSSSSQDFTFLPPNMGELFHSAEQYYQPDLHVIELHLDILDSEANRLPKIGTLFSVERTVTYHWNGLEFPALNDEDAFLLQVAHTCRHFFIYWIRMSSLFEIGYFLTRRASETSLWGRIEQRVGDNLVLRDFVAITAELVTRLFAAPLPAVVRAWAEELRPAARVWMENYARQWAFADLPVHHFSLFPKSKLVLFLHQQYEGESAQKHIVRTRLLATSRLRRVAADIRKKPSLAVDLGWWKHQLLIRHGMFHALAGLRYLCEIPRWLWLNRTRRPASVNG